MAYNYNTQKDKLFTPEGLQAFIAVYENVNKLLAEAGAFMAYAAWEGDNVPNTDSWTLIAILDYLVEIGKIKEITKNVFAQYRVFIKADIE